MEEIFSLVALNMKSIKSGGCAAFDDEQGKHF